MSDKGDKISRVPISELTALDTGEVMLRANDALVLHELRGMLVRQAERDILIADLSREIASFKAGQSTQEEQIASLQRAHGVLVRQQVALYERQEVIASVCDAIVERLDSQTRDNDKLAKDNARLASEVADKD